VAVAAVDGFEVVHVDERGYEAFSCAPRPVHLALKLVEPDPAPAGPGELVGPGPFAVARGLLAVTRGQFAVACGELAVAGSAPAIVLCALACRRRTAAELLDTQGVLVVDPVAAVEAERLLVRESGRLVPLRRDLVALASRLVTLLGRLVATAGALPARARRPGAYGARLGVGDQVSALLAIQVGCRLVVVRRLLIAVAQGSDRDRSASGRRQRASGRHHLGPRPSG
jgi:hypothetical protein